MKRYFISLTVMVIFVAAVYFLMSNVDAPPKPVRIEKSGAIVRLVRGGRTYCSGTVVSDHVIITAGHCVLLQTMMGYMIDSMPIEIRDNNNVPLGVTATVNYATPQMDQALLVGDFTQFEHKHLHTQPEVLSTFAVEGKHFVACGYPLGGDLYCSNLTYQRKFGFYWETTGDLYPGMSGGPTMLDDGTLVAVNTAVEGEYSIVSPIYNLTRNLVRK